MIASTSVNIVHISSKLSEALPSSFVRHVFTDRTTLSQNPPHQAARSAMNFQVMPLSEKNSNSWGSLIAFHSYLRSWSALLNVIALSEEIILHNPFLEINLFNANRNDSVDWFVPGVLLWIVQCMTYLQNHLPSHKVALRNQHLCLRMVGILLFCLWARAQWSAVRLLPWIFCILCSQPQCSWLAVLHIRSSISLSLARECLSLLSASPFHDSTVSAVFSMSVCWA